MNTKILGGLAAAAVVGTAVYVVSTDRIADQAGSADSPVPQQQTSSDPGTGGETAIVSATAAGISGKLTSENVVDGETPEAVHVPTSESPSAIVSPGSGPVPGSRSGDEIALSEASYCWDPFAWLNLANQMFAQWFVVPAPATDPGTAPLSLPDQAQTG